MRVVLDCTSVPRRPAGAGRYALELAQALAVRATDPAEDLDLTILERWGMLVGLERPGVRVRQVGPANRWLRVVWEQTILPLRLRRLRPDVYHSTHHWVPLVPIGAAKVVTVHDMTFRLFPQRYPAANRLYMRWSTAASMAVAHAVIVPSRAVESDLRRLQPPHRASVHVVPEGASESFNVRRDSPEVEAAGKRYSLPERYLFHLGTSEPGKNRALLLEAYERVRATHPDVGLVLAGQKGWGEQQEVPPGVLDLGYLPQDDLPLLYAGAEAFVFPSLYEGFGLPILEAMASGTPVVTAVGGACAEVAGAAGIVVDPLTVEDLAEAVSRVLDDPALRSQLVEAGRKRAAEFSWERAARETLAIYRSAASRG